jgi:hypothetical protein
MPRHYNTATADLDAINVNVTGVNAETVNADTVDALTVNTTDLDCDTMVATTVSGNNVKVSGDIHTMDGDIIVAASGGGIILRDDNGVHWRVGVDILGNLETTAI